MFYSHTRYTISSYNHFPDLLQAFDIAEKEFGVAPVMSVCDLQICEVPDQLTMVSYLSQFYDYFRKESSAPPAKSEYISQP